MAKLRYFLKRGPQKDCKHELERERERGKDERVGETETRMSERKLEREKDSKKGKE